MAHIATPNQDQVAQGECSYQTQEGCFGEASMLARFVNKFWSSDDLIKAENQEDVYSEKPDNFVTEYAGTNPEEDIAESFAYYVVRSSYSSRTISDQKQIYFGQFSDAKTLKKDMRKAVLQVFVRARAGS